MDPSISVKAVVKMAISMSIKQRCRKEGKKTSKRWTLGWRDIAVNNVCNWIINSFATKEYRAFIQVTTTLGKLELDKVVADWLHENKDKCTTN